MRRAAALLTAILSAPLAAQPARVLTSPAITAADLRLRLGVVADDSMQGRETGSVGDWQTAAYVAAEFRRLGLEPAGEGGTYFQTVPFFAVRIAPATGLTAAGTTLRAGAELLPYGLAATVQLSDVPVVYGGSALDTAGWIAPRAAAGRVVVIDVPADPARAEGFRQVGGVARSARFAGAALVVVAAADLLGGEIRSALASPRIVVDTARALRAPIVLATRATARLLLGADPASVRPGTPGATVRGTWGFEVGPTERPARNVVAVLRGSDPRVRGEYVAVTAHNDHVGFDHVPVDHDSLRAWNRVMRPLGADTPPREPTAAERVWIRALLDSLRHTRPPRLDSIRNGADDDGSGTVALLEIAERLATEPARPRRSILFVSHTGEEKGLVGSAWYTDHATVPVDSIVADIDEDMVGRGDADDLPKGGPAYLELVGARRLSREYGDLLEAVNARQPAPFRFNEEFDTPGHPLQQYCRADHFSYARYGIPSVSLSRGEHLDYHQVTDEAAYIDYDALARVATLVHDFALAVANLDHPLRLDTARPADPHRPCRQ